MMEARRAEVADWATLYLGGIEEMGVDSEYEDLYLWPRTPLNPDLQDVIARRVGVDDFEVQDPRSRSAMIVTRLRELIDDPAAGMRDDFRLVDVACGDAVVLWQIKKAFPRADCHGVDCNKGVFSTHAQAMAEGVLLHKGYLQHLFVRSPPDGHRFDMALMLNTYRGWESADLRESERDLPEQADAWFARNSRFVVVTATRAQITRLRREGWFVAELGKGEDESIMICASREYRRSRLARAGNWLRGRLGR